MLKDLERVLGTPCPLDAAPTEPPPPPPVVPEPLNVMAVLASLQAAPPAPPTPPAPPKPTMVDRGCQTGLAADTVEFWSEVRVQ